VKRLALIAVAAAFTYLNSFSTVGIAAGPPATVVAWAGTPQSTPSGTTFPVRLVVAVRDASTNGVQGVTVTFSAPSVGASGTFGGSLTATAVTDATGAAIAPVLTANGQSGSFSLTASVTGVAALATFSLTNTGGAAGTSAPQAPTNVRLITGEVAPSNPAVTAVAGTPQSTTVNTAFAIPLQALVRDAGNNPLSGVSVTFTTPASGASARFGGNTTATGVTNASGVATAPTLTANGVAGSYAVTASMASATTATFNLTNSPVVQPPPGGGGGTRTWTNVTPGNVDLTSHLDCDNFGTQTVAADPARPSNLYAQFNCQGVWKSTDYGLTWTGPINTGSGGQGVKGAGGIAIGEGSNGQPPILYAAGIRGTGYGFWRSTDGGVSWTNHFVAPGGASRQDFYAPVVNPYNRNHLLMAGHEMNLMVQSVDGGQNWTAIPMAPGMNGGATAFIFFINTGNPTTTASTWLFIGQGTGGAVGTWRTTNGGSSWTQVDKNEHPHGEAQIYQPDTSGVVYMAGVYSQSGWGVLRSTDYGQTWSHVGINGNEAVVFGSPNNVYAMYAWACGGCTVDPVFQSAPQPGSAGWALTPTPSGMAMGAAQAAVVFDGTRYVIITANWRSGLWRYVE
jgi:hypothetical protein